ncbi:MAG: sugar phosphate isomerase/epimerase [Chthoniobacterales bacterium]|nr:sugar phosphate isomerase/epimerase [Chthoniobacterales bacterium]
MPPHRRHGCCHHARATAPAVAMSSHSLYEQSRPVKLSCADFTFPLLPHGDVLALIGLLGLNGVDLGVFKGRSHWPPEKILADIPAAMRSIKSSLDRRGLAVADVFLQTGEDPAVHAANDPDADIRAANREMFRGIVEFAVGIGAAHLTGLPGVWHRGTEKAADWQLAVSEAAWRKSHAAQNGIRFAVEAHVGSVCPDPESALRFVQEAGVTLTLDYGHFVYQGMPPQAADILIPQASHFHARGGAKGQLQSTMKDSVIDFRAIRDALQQRGYPGWMCLEYVWIDWEGCNRTDNVSETIILRDLLLGAGSSPAVQAA